MKNPHWHYFISLEKDFLDSLQFVELHPDNKKAFSVVYAKMLFATCSEIEVVLKALAEKYVPGKNPQNIDAYRQITLGVFPAFHKIEVEIPRYMKTAKPWNSWSANTNPPWWHAYNKVKHNRAVEFEEANQGNVLDAICALFAVLIYFYQSEINAGNFTPEPQLLDYPSMFPSRYVSFRGLKLPQ